MPSSEFQKESETGIPSPYPEALLAIETVGGIVVNIHFQSYFFFPENIVVLFFIFEYCIRFIFSPRKFRFFKQVVANADFCHFCS